MIANRFQPLLPHTLHTDHVEFVSTREARDNTLISFLLTHHAEQRGIPMCLLSVDKAFDRVSRPLLFHILRQWGIGQTLLGKIQALYANPSANVRVNGSLSSSFSMTNRTHQGCPLSLLLYVLTMEHLALRANPNISCLQVDPHPF